MLSIGIDFGTSNSSVAVFDGQATRLLPLDGHARNPQVMRSLLYIPRYGEIVAGQRALDLYTEQNTGREVKMERRYLRPVTMTFSDMSVTKDAYAMVDVNEPGRLFQSLKRFLPITSFEKTNVFGQEYQLEELVATLARKMVRSAEAAVGERIHELTVGRPVRFSEDDAKDEAARGRLEEAWRRAGIRSIRFMEEPVAAAHHYAAEAGLAPGATFLVVDFGGGTLDVTVARAGEPAIEVLATGGVPVGGDLLDSRMMQTRVAHHFGRGARYRQQGLPVPNHIFSRLRSWQTIVELNRPDLMELIRVARRTADKPRELAALETLVSRNRGLELFRAIEEAKIQLSTAEEVTVRLQREGIDVAEEITRGEFEAAISTQLREARECVLDAVERAGCEPEEIGLVITTGGSSLIPAFRRTLEESLPNASLAATGTFTSVAAGLALAGAKRPRADKHADQPMNEPAGDGEEFEVRQLDDGGGQDWVVSWHPPVLPPPNGKRHGSSAVCLTSDGDVVLVRAGESWDLPGGRPEGDEHWRATLDREVLEEACALVEEATPLGFAKSVCASGPEEGLVLIRCYWRATVSLREWDPQHETRERLVLPANEALAKIAPSGGLLLIFRRLFHEALGS